MRKPYLAGNWKMHMLRSEAEQLASELVKELSDCSHKLMVAPPFTSLETVVEVIKGSNILLGAQNVSAYESGAHTGEISADMLLDIGVKVVIIGHSERRHKYAEGDDLINKKVLLSLVKGLEVILCVGETIEERESGKVEDVVGSQIKNGLNGVSESALEKLTIAYEPVWAIGTGKTASPEDADEVHSFIRSELSKQYSKQATENMIIQYGGSVKPANVKDLMTKENIDGALVGGASLKSETFVPIAKYNS